MREPDEHHLRRGAAVRRLVHLREALQQHLPGAAEHGDGELGGQHRAARALLLGQGGLVAQGGHADQTREGMRQLEHVREDHARVAAAFMRAVHQGQAGGHVAGQRGLGQVHDQAAVGEAQHLGDRRRGDAGFAAAAQRDRLVEQREPVAHGPVRRARQHLQRRLLGRHALLRGDAGEMGAQLGLGDAAQEMGLAAGADGGGHLPQLGRRQHELHLRRRLLQRLQQSVESRRRTKPQGDAPRQKTNCYWFPARSDLRRRFRYRYWTWR